MSLKPRLYYTRTWKQFCEPILQKEFEKINEAGFDTYNWATPAHAAKDKCGQLEIIDEWLQPPRTKVFVWDVTDYERSHGSSVHLWVMALARGIPCIIVDGKYDERERDNGGIKTHPALSFLCGHTMQRKVNNMQTVVVRSLDEALSLAKTMDGIAE